MGNLHAVLASLTFVLLVVVTMVPPPAHAASSPMRFGMDIDSIDGQTTAGVKPDYAMIWIGPWTLKWGWGGPDAALARAKAAGVTPVIQFYYWGDDISVACLENGCQSGLHDAPKNKANWQLLADQTSEHLQQQLGGGPAVIIVESEFNKGDAARYEPLDGYLAEKADHFHKTYPAAQVVLGFGNWAPEHWNNFDRAAAGADLIGLQAMRASTRDTAERYEGVLDATLGGAKTLRSLFGRPLIVTDLALSSYPEPDYAQRQAKVIGRVFERLPEFKALDVRGLLYRSLYDAPNMDTANYFGEAERHWGLAWASNGTGKPALKAWVDGIQRERATATTSAAPTTTTAAAAPMLLDVEAEAFATKSSGGREADGQASAGNRWNLWANGHLTQGFQAPTTGDYRVLVWARGQPLAGVLPHMTVTIDGQDVFQADPAKDAFRVYQGAPRLTAGTHEIKVAFTNDARTAQEDRNLLLDRVVVQPILTFEAESFSSRSAGGVQADATAWAGQRWNQWAQGASGHTFLLPAAGQYEVRVRAQGQSLGGVNPHMVVQFDGATVREADPAPGAWTEFTAKAAAGAAGNHAVGILFTNDAAGPTGDRNLLVDRVEILRSG